MNTQRKVCLFTGTRAEYGLLRGLINGIYSSNKLTLQLVVTGAHLSPEFGLTLQEIVDDGYPVSRKIEILLSSDTTVGVAKSMGLGVLSFADALSELKPDLVVVLGDRYEIFSAASAAMLSRIPIAHIHGGEVTQGAIDEAIRHSITKMAHLHFVATSEYRNRVIQLGENPNNVFNVGGLGVDNLLGMQLLSREDLQDQLGFKFLDKNILVTFHPVTLEDTETSVFQFRQLLLALESLESTGIIFTLPNADAAGRSLISMVKEFCDSNSFAACFASLGQLRYFSCVHQVDCVIGNSSSGLLEVPSFKKVTINIGSRQAGRLKASSVIDALPSRQSILDALSLAYSFEFQEVLQKCSNPYGNGGSADSILNILEEFPLDNILHKQFYDLP